MYLEEMQAVRSNEEDFHLQIHVRFMREITSAISYCTR